MFVKLYGKKAFVVGSFQWPTTKTVTLTGKKNSPNTKTQDKLYVYLGQMFIDSCYENKLINIICWMSVKYCTKAVLSEENPIFHCSELENASHI